jgi:hypothetical protein
MAMRDCFSAIRWSVSCLWVASFITMGALAQDPRSTDALPVATTIANLGCSLHVRYEGTAVSGRQSLRLTGSELRVTRKDEFEVQSVDSSGDVNTIPASSLEYVCTSTNCLIGISAKALHAETRVRVKCSNGNWSSWRMLDQPPTDENAAGGRAGSLVSLGTKTQKTP